MSKIEQWCIQSFFVQTDVIHLTYEGTTIADTHWWFCKIHILKKLYGYKLVRALKQFGMKRLSKWYRRNHTTQYKYLPRLMTGSWSVKKSRKKIEHLHNMLHILMNENICGQFLLSFRHLLFNFFFHFLFFQHFCLLSYFKIIKCIVKLLITIFIECQPKKDNLKSVFGCQRLGAQIGILVSQTARIYHCIVFTKKYEQLLALDYFCKTLSWMFDRIQLNLWIT